MVLPARQCQTCNLLGDRQWQVIEQGQTLVCIFAGHHRLPRMIDQSILISGLRELRQRASQQFGGYYYFDTWTQVVARHWSARSVQLKPYRQQHEVLPPAQVRCRDCGQQFALQQLAGKKITLVNGQLAVRCPTGCKLILSCTGMEQSYE